MKGAKINSLNKLCHQFNTNLLAGCKTQADWRQASNEQKFRNVIGVGMETRSIVARNINERMQRDQYGGCAMMVMGCFSAEVIKTGVDPYGLVRWFWLRDGSGDKKTEQLWSTNPQAQNQLIPPEQPYVNNTNSTLRPAATCDRHVQSFMNS